jgi:sugar/nucleoside kinase (ribokinase family)
MIMMHYDVLGIGNAIVDVIAHTNDKFLNQNGIVKGAMSLIDAPRAQVLYEFMEEKIETSGGSAANSLAGMSSLGAKTAFIGKVSNDPLGSVFSQDMAKIGVDFHTLVQKDKTPTARSMIFVSPDGERSMNTYLGSCVELTPQDIDEKTVAESKITYFEGYLWDPPLAKDAIMIATNIAHKNDRKVAMTLSDKFCVDRYRLEFLNLIRSKTVDIVFANEHEVMALYELSSVEDAVNALRADCTMAAITLSHKGSVIISHTQTYDIAPFPVKTVIDTTGAGDLYAAGVLFGMTQGYDLVRCGALGSLAASIVIQQIGPRPHVNLRDYALTHQLI